MKKQGTVVRWDAERAFGFIRSPQIPADVFFHLRDFTGHPGPREGLQVTFDEIHVGGKGPRALSVSASTNTILAPTAETPPDEAALLPPGRRATPRSTPPHLKKRDDRLVWSALGLMALWLLLWLIGIGLGRFPWVVLTGVVMLNLLTFYVYWRDKHAATAGDWRVSENQLHGLALAGGWPGAWFAQQILRHKSSKQPFRSMYWATVGLNYLGLLAWIFWPQLSGV
ncbi:DUF1294 domain-containing protein [Hydrogenophaga sp.]|uniref:DUF1294 domain-containing protein n=1 Tax=Hydrogenophaga sp. TaxID=1904254 RepID=UPI0035629DA0